MSQYLIAYNYTQGFDSAKIHEAITAIPTVTDWWHYLPNLYIVITTSDAKYLADRIISKFQGLLFLVVRLDTRDYSGVLNKEAWEWIRSKNTQYVKLKAVPGSPARLPQLLSPILPQRGLTKPTSLYELLGIQRR